MFIIYIYLSLNSKKILKQIILSCCSKNNTLIMDQMILGYVISDCPFAYFNRMAHFKGQLISAGKKSVSVMLKKKLSPTRNKGRGFVSSFTIHQYSDSSGNHLLLNPFTSHQRCYTLWNRLKKVRILLIFWCSCLTNSRLRC